MKERIGNVFRSFAASLCSAALMALGLAIILILYDEPHSVQLAVFRWAGFLFAVAVFNEVLAPRGLPLLAYAAVNAAAAAAGVYAVLGASSFVPASEGYAVFLGFLIASSTALCAFFAQNLPDSNVFVRLTDAILCCVGALMAFAQYLGHPLNTGVLGFACAALLLSVAAASALRAGGESSDVVRGSGIGGVLVLALMLAVGLVLCLALAVLGGGQVDGMVAAAAMLWDKLGWLLEKIMMAFAALLSLNLGKYIVLKPQTEHYTVTIVPLGEEEAAGSAPMWLVYGFLAFLALALLALVIGLLLDLRGKRVIRERRAAKKRVVTRKSHLLDAILAFIKRAVNAAAFETAYRFGKRTPQKLVVYASRRFRGRHHAKRHSESPGAYMRRLHAALTAQQASSSLDQLADLLDEEIYGQGGRTLEKEEYAVYASQIRLIRSPWQIKQKRND
ncbi:MAG: hypothetical protein IKV90_08835 [Clostridia bacterium]|nr:hypothetical protein [Clostridia bacterium]